PGGRELVQTSTGAAFLPIELRPDRGAKASEAIFKTTSKTLPGVTVEVKRRDPRNGLLELSLKLERAAILQARACATSPSARLRTRLVVDDGAHAPVVLDVEPAWRCGKGELKTP